MMHEMASSILQYGLEKVMIDVPLALQHGKHEWPLGRFLRRKLRKYIGRSENAPQEILDNQAHELQALRQSAWDSSQALTQKILDESLGRRIKIEAKHRRQKREAL